MLNLRILSSLTLVTLFVGCGGTAEPTEPTPVGTTTGGETGPAGEGRTVTVFRTTIPVPVPQPATPREELLEPVQQIWTATEEIVAMRPPEPPTEADAEVIRAWTEDPFAPWVSARQTAIQQVEPLVDAIGDEVVQRAAAAALFGYMYEDTAAGIRGAPVPVDIAEDEELLAIYVDALNAALGPFAQRAVESYAFCATTIAGLGESPWIPWGAYCLERGREVATVYGLVPAAPEAPAETAD